MAWFVPKNEKSSNVKTSFTSSTTDFDVAPLYSKSFSEVLELISFQSESVMDVLGKIVMGSAAPVVSDFN